MNIQKIRDILDEIEALDWDTDSDDNSNARLGKAAEELETLKAEIEAAIETQEEEEAERSAE